MLIERVPLSGSLDPDEILDRFLDWVIEIGLEPYPAQEEALLELMAGQHVILSTPTGSGKSLVATGLHFKAMCEGRRSYYTSPTKALASEKFFTLCNDFGAENVGMLTGDAGINADAPIIGCTAEILANQTLRDGAAGAPAYVIMDEFHYYADPDRGAAWQIPLITLPDTTFLLMSATLGDTREIERHIRTRTDREVAHITSDERPVPLDYEYRETPVHETVEYLVDARKAPIYIVSFTQRECGELAQALTSVNVCTKDEKATIAKEIANAPFDSPYGKDLRRFIRQGIAVHHGGLLPKYRLLVEKLAQKGLLKIVCGTDTLGVGVNIPIRTVLFNKLAKYDGQRTGILKARDFRQISGRAGRKGFDDRGSVVCQAPEHVIEKRRAAMRAASSGKKKAAKKKAPPGAVVWSKKTFDQLIERPPEQLRPQFAVTHGMLLNVLQRPPQEGAPGGYAAFVDVIQRCHESDDRKPQLLRDAAARLRELRRAEIVYLIRYDIEAPRPYLEVSAELQDDFSLHETLSLYLFDAVAVLDPDADDEPHAMAALTLVESILENPRAVLYAQERRAKGDLIGRLKADGVPYEERMQLIEDVTHPQPDAEFINATFDAFAAKHPWVGHTDIKPKSVAREMYEGYSSFEDYVRRYGLQRSEGLLVRYLSQVYKTLTQSVPDKDKSDAVYDVEAYLRTTLTRIDSSLIEEWERLVGIDPLALEVELTDADAPVDLARDRKLFVARVRSELHSLVRALAAGDYEEAARAVRSDVDDPWDAERFERALAPFYEDHEAIVFTPISRKAEHTAIRQLEPRRWSVTQVLVDPSGDNFWHIAGHVDLTGETDPTGPMLTVYDIGT